MSNPLVAQASSSTTWYTGLALVEDAAQITKGIQNNSWVDTTLGGVGGSLDLLGLAIDPLGSLAAWGVAWLMEHVKPLQEALDALAGNPDEVAAHAQTWQNVAQFTRQSRERLTNAVTKDTGHWLGAAGDAYRDHAATHASVLDGITTAAGGIAAAVSGAGLLVGLVRGLVRELIAQFVATLAVRLPQWLAETGLTLGVATPVVIGQVASLVAKWANKIQHFIRALLNSLQQLRPLIQQLGETLTGLKQLTTKLARSTPVQIKIGSLNTGGLRDMGGKENLAMFRGAMEPKDMWFIQEDHSRDGASLAGKIATESGMTTAIHTPAGGSFLDPTYQMGNTFAVGPRAKVSDFSEYPYPNPDFQLYFQGKPVEPLDRFLQVAKVKIDGSEYTAVNVHLPPMDALGYKGGYLEAEGAEYARVLERFILDKVHGDRIIVAGDFNVDDIARAFPDLVKNLGLVDALADVSATVPWGTRPDHIMVPSRYFEVVNAKAVDFGADHYSCVATLRMRSWIERLLRIG